MNLGQKKETFVRASISTQAGAQEKEGQKPSELSSTRRLSAKPASHPMKVKHSNIAAIKYSRELRQRTGVHTEYRTRIHKVFPKGSLLIV